MQRHGRSRVDVTRTEWFGVLDLQLGAHRAGPSTSRQDDQADAADLRRAVTSLGAALTSLESSYALATLSRCCAELGERREARVRARSASSCSRAP